MATDNTHLLPDTSTLLGLPMDVWIITLTVIFFIARLVYTLVVVSGVKQLRTRCSLYRISESMVFVALIVLLLGAQLVLPNRLPSDPSEDPLNKQICLFFTGVGVELLFLLASTLRRIRESHNRQEITSNGENPWFSVNRRLAWFLLFVGTASVANYCNQRRRNSIYDYFGPMRITTLPRTSLMDNIHRFELENYECLNSLVARNRTVRENGLDVLYVDTRVEIGWGRAWGCADPSNQERWNTNRPSVPRCARFLCPHINDTIDLSPCQCYESEEEATNATWQCLDSMFNLTPLRANETFDQDQPPWNDPSWPTMDRYGTCDGEVGTSLAPSYVRGVKFNGERQLTFGIVCLVGYTALWAVQRWQQDGGSSADALPN